MGEIIKEYSEWGIFDSQTISKLDLQNDFLNWSQLAQEIKQINIPKGKNLRISIKVIIAHTDKQIGTNGVRV